MRCSPQPSQPATISNGVPVCCYTISHDGEMHLTTRGRSLSLSHWLFSSRREWRASFRSSLDLHTESSLFFFSLTREGLENRDSCIHPHSLTVEGWSFFWRGRGVVGMDAGASPKLELAFDRSQMSNLLLLGSKSRQTKKKHTTPHKSIQLKIHL